MVDLNSEYFARLRYEENRNRKTPRIFFIKKIPVAFIHSNGEVSHYVVNNTMDELRLQRVTYVPSKERFETPVEMVYDRFRLQEFHWVKGGMMYRFAVFMEVGAGIECAYKAKQIVSKQLLRFK